MSFAQFSRSFEPDGEAMVRCIQRQGTPQRPHNIELFLDDEVQDAVCERFNLLEDLPPDDAYFPQKRHLRIQRHLGYDYAWVGLEGMIFPLNLLPAEDTAKDLKRSKGREFMNEHRGPITTWEEFERYPWPDPHQAADTSLTWFNKNLPDDMIIIGSNKGHFAELLNWLMGYESLCYALYDQRDLVKAISDRLIEYYRVVTERVVQFERVEVLWASDDMGFRTGTLISPADLREFVLPGHKLLAEIAHRAGKPYLLHCCGQIKDIMEDLIEDVGIDAKHSFEDTIEPVTHAKQTYGRRISLLGGIDVDFLCRADEKTIRQRVRDTLDICQPGGGYCLGTGNSVANYIPLDNYLIMMDESRRYGSS